MEQHLPAAAQAPERAGYSAGRAGEKAIAEANKTTELPEKKKAKEQGDLPESDLSLAAAQRGEILLTL